MSEDAPQETIRWITLDLQEDGRLGRSGIEAFVAAVSRPAAGNERLAAVRSVGADFCAGRDPGQPSGRPTGSVSLHLRDVGSRGIVSVYEAMSRSQLPIVACVRGRAHGLGCAIAAGCDVTYVAEDADFALPELRAGVPPTLAISALLPSIPRKALMELALSGRSVRADEALRLGLASRRVADPEAEATSLAQALGEVPVRALSTLRSYMSLSLGRGEAEARSLAAEMLSFTLAEQAR